MSRPPRRNTGKRGQPGAVLIVALVTLVAVLMLGVSAARMALLGEKAARGERDRQIAFQAAEEALMDAENDIEGSAAFPGRSALFGTDSAVGFSDGCGAGAANPALGLCLRAPPGQAAAWLVIDLADADPASTRSVPFGQFTGAVMPAGQGFLPFRRPRYVIELLPYAQPGQDAGANPSYVYRVTALGFGASERTQVVLQSIYRKKLPRGGVN